MIKNLLNLPAQTRDSNNIYINIYYWMLVLIWNEAAILHKFGALLFF